MLAPIVAPPRRRTRWSWLVFVAVGLLLPLLPDGWLVSSASADISSVDPFQLCSQATGTCPAYPSPAPLVSEAALANLPPDQADAVRSMEAQAVQDIISSHGLSSTDGNAVQSWGRTDAQAELWLLIVQAIQTTPGQRTDVQQGVVDWMSGMYSAQEHLSTEQAGAEYAKWAGLDVSHYWDLAGSASESQLTDFLSSAVNTYNNPDPTKATGGYCAYKPPAPDSSDYDGSQASTCFAPCAGPLECVPPTPDYDKFVKWGDDETNYATIAASGFNVQASAVAESLAGVEGAIGGGAAATVTGTLLPGPTLSTLASTISPFQGVEWFLAKNGETAEEIIEMGVESAARIGFQTAADVADVIAGVGAVVTIVLFAIITAITEGINVGTAAAVPAKIAKLVVDERSQTNDLASMLTDTTKLTVLYDLFIGATLPLPKGDATCQRDYILSGQATGIDPVFTEYYALTLQPDQLVPNTLVSATPCLNPPAIPAASPTDPQFLVTGPGSPTPTVSPTISLHDQPTGLDSTVRLSGNWFVQHASLGSAEENVQTLDLGYTDWSGHEEKAQLVHGPTGYRFVGITSPGSGATIDPDTCRDDGTCWASDHIDYLGTDGGHYSATVQGWAPDVGKPRWSPPVEGIPASFNAGDFAPGNPVGHLSYTWEFELQACSVATLCVAPSLAHFSSPQTGANALYTWPGPGQALVRLTATDQQGHQAVNEFSVSVGDQPPTMRLAPACPSATEPCNQTAADVGQTVSVSGSAHDSGTDDFENVAIQWGDGTSNQRAAGQGIVNLADPNLSFTQDESDPSTFRFTATHAYPGPGVYFGTATVSDFEGGTTSKVFTARVTGKQQISFAPLADGTYGDQVHVSATGSRSGQPVTYTADPGSVCAATGVDGSTVTMVGIGQCTVTAHQAAAPAYFLAADPVSRSFTVSPAPLLITAADARKSYGDPDPDYSATYTGLVRRDTPADISGLTLTGPPTGSHAGNYPIVPSGAIDPDYTISYQPGTLTIDTDHLTVTADDLTRRYGEPDDFTATFDGLANGDDAADLAGLAFTTDEGPHDRVGSYRITPGGIDDPDYHVGYVPGTLTVTPAPLTITADPLTVASGTTAPYSWHGSGWVDGDSDDDLGQGGHLSPTCQATVLGLPVTAATRPGRYPGAITCAGASDADYDIDYAAGTLTVDPVVTLTQTGLPRGAEREVDLDGVWTRLPVDRLQVGYATTHSARFPGLVIAPNGRIYTTGAANSSGAVTDDLTAVATYSRMRPLLQAALAAGTIHDRATVRALCRAWAPVQGAVSADRNLDAAAHLRGFAAAVRAHRASISAATSTLLISRAQLVLAGIGGGGSL